MKTIPIRKLPSGIRYGFGNSGERICLGAQMGRRDMIPDDICGVVKMRLVKLRMTSEGCYDQGGAYWGQGNPLFWAYGENEVEQAEIFIRANNRQEAKNIVRETFPNVRFYN